MDDLKKGLIGVGIFTAVGGFVTLFIISPIITFGCAYLGGVILNYFVGDHLIDGLNLVFDTTRFTRDLIPLTCATLATIGKYFRSSQTNNNSKDK